MIKFITGDIFATKPSIIINTVNCVGVMGKGIALTFKNKHPDMFAAYKKACIQKHVVPGKPHLWQDPAYLIINFPTKVDWRNPSEYEYIEAGLIWLRDFLADKPDERLAMPPLGCGCGGLDWNRVKALIIKHLHDCNTTILVSEPANFKSESETSMNKLKIAIDAPNHMLDYSLFADKLDFYLSNQTKDSVVLYGLKFDPVFIGKYASQREIAFELFETVDVMLASANGLIAFYRNTERESVAIARQKGLSVKTVDIEQNPIKTDTSIFHIGLTGHRPTKLGGYDLSQAGYQGLQNHLETIIEMNLQNYDIVVGHSGLALGADTIWSKAILNMRNKYPGRVKFHAEIPMMSQASVWFKKADIDFWHEQVNTADFKTVYGDLSEFPEDQRKKLSSKFLDDRNRGMLDHSDELLAVWDGSKGGTGNAVAYAKKTNLKTIVIEPKRFF